MKSKINNGKLKILPPVIVTFIGLALYLGVVLVQAGGDPLVFVRIGTQFSEGDPNGTEGYDGQFIYYIARNPNPRVVAPFLDDPPYRYQRILLPLLARSFTFTPSSLPWVLILLGVLIHISGTLVVAILLQDWRINPWYSIIYGLWPGFLLTVRLDLPEPLAYGLVAAAILLMNRDKLGWAWVLLGISVFAKEVTVLYIGALGFKYVWDQDWKRAFGLGLVAIVPFLIFQLWLYQMFGDFGIASGGAGVEPVEWIPFMGAFRIGQTSVLFMFVVLIVLGPSIILPSVWGIITGIRQWVAGKRDFIVAALFFNALIIPITPLSTFREPGAMIRFSSGMILAILLFAAKYRRRKVLNYGLFWLALNAILFT